MRTSLAVQALWGASVASGLTLPLVSKLLDPLSLPLLPASAFHRFNHKSLEQAKADGAASRGPATNTNAATAAASDGEASIAADCENPPVRLDWHNYVQADRVALVEAMQRMKEAPSAGNFGASQSRWEDFVVVHQQATPNIHSNQIFLLWHRYFLHAFESVLREEFGFDKGAFAWWDERVDAGNFAASDIFTNDYLGALPPRNADDSSSCITDGKFYQYVLHVGPGEDNTDHCLSRGVREDITDDTGSQYVDECNARGTFTDMSSCFEIGPHAAGHNSVGGDMSDLYSAVHDPLFFLHHGFVDRNYLAWQNGDPNRKTSIDGCADGSNPCTNPLTLDTTISIGGLRPDVTVGDVINTRDGVLCYVYDK